jgi:autotransporter adhesin
LTKQFIQRNAPLITHQGGLFMKFSTLSLWATLFLLSVSASFAFAQPYEAGGGNATGLSATAVGPGNSIVSGADIKSIASGDSSSAYGRGSSASGANSSAFGRGSTASGSDSSSYGNQSIASGDGSVALGSNANAAATGTVAIGSGAVANEANTVSVGTPGAERRITNVAPGTAPTDAVNMSQLSQFSQFGQINGLRTEISNVARQSYRGIAGVAALTSAPPSIPGKTSVNFGLGAYRGYFAGAVNASHTSETGSLNFNGGIGISAGQPVYRAGVGFSF